MGWGGRVLRLGRDKMYHIYGYLQYYYTIWNKGEPILELRLDNLVGITMVGYVGHRSKLAQYGHDRGAHVWRTEKGLIPAFDFPSPLTSI